jgi:beta-glucosidase
VDRVSLDLPGRQFELVAALAATGKPVVVVLVNGAPIGSEPLAAHAAALIEAWEPGMQGGTAIAEVLFGKYNPSGKLPMSFPRSVGHLKGYYNHRPSAYHRGKFRFASSGPLFSFGHGLSYTQFAYRALRAKDTLSIGEALRVDVELENIGRHAGEEVVLLYVQDVYASVTRPVRELKAFQRVQLEPGQKKTVQLVLEPDAFSLFDANMNKVTEPGEFRLSLGADHLEKSVWLR